MSALLRGEDPAAARRLWAVSAELTGLTDVTA
jgi:hypothetical protein